MDDTAVIILMIHQRGVSIDLEVPLDITANNLILALNATYNLGIDTNNILNCYLKAENPIALVKGNKTLAEFGIRNGTIIHFTD